VTNNKPRDASTPHGSTVGESVRNLIKKNPRYSKRINYDALRDLFDGAGPSADEEEQKMTIDDVEMYTMDPEMEGDVSGVVVEEGGGAIGMTPTAATVAAAKSTTSEAIVDEDGEGEIDDEMYADFANGDEDVEGDWDAYEQEV
jgi:transcription factor IIIB 90 kDa subunit